MGVNLHMGYTDGLYANSNQVLQDLQYIGLHNVRDGVPTPSSWQFIAAMKLLAGNGIKWNLLAAPSQGLQTNMRQIDAFLANDPGAVLSVEGPNEINNQPVSGPGSNEQNAEAYQRSLYAAVHSDPNLKGIPVLYFTGGASMNLDANPGLADATNTHPYPKQGTQPLPTIQYNLSAYFSGVRQTDAKQITELGYYTILDGVDGVSEPAQAEMLFNSYFDAALQGYSRTFLYELLDAYPGQSFGLFHYPDGSPKIAAVALNHFAAVFPPDKPSAQQTVQAAITGMPSTGHVLALTGSDGSITVFLWNEAPVWDHRAGSLIWVNPLPVQVQIPGFWNVSYFTPADNTTFPVAQSSGSYQTYVASYPTALIFKKK